MHKTCKIMQTILCHILVYSNHQLTNLILNDLYYTQVCTYWHLLSMYFSTHYKNRNWNLLWEFYSFLSFKIRILDLAFNIWSYHFSPILVHDLFQSLSFSSYPRNFFRIDLMKKKILSSVNYFFFASLKKNITIVSKD